MVYLWPRPWCVGFHSICQSHITEDTCWNLALVMGHREVLTKGLNVTHNCCTISTNCSQSVTCDACEHFEVQFTNRCDMWHHQEVFISPNDRPILAWQVQGGADSVLYAVTHQNCTHFCLLNDLVGMLGSHPTLGSQNSIYYLKWYAIMD
jgi:hypothetical protein